MKILITYYSRTGNTKKVAYEIKKILKADIDEIIDAKERMGIKGWLIAGRDAMKKRLTEIKYKKDPKNYDLVIIGTPIWSFTAIPPIRTYLRENKKSFKNVAFFSTSGSTSIEKIADEMAKESKKPIALLELHTKGWSQKIDLENKAHMAKIKEFCEKIRNKQ